MNKYKKRQENESDGIIFILFKTAVSFFRFTSIILVKNMVDRDIYDCYDFVCFANISGFGAMFFKQLKLVNHEIKIVILNTCG